MSDDLGGRRAGVRIRATMRLARRSALRAKGRSALIAAMVAIPVAGMTAVAVVGLSMVPTVEEEVAVELGEMQAWLAVLNAPDPTLEQSPTEPYWFEVERDANYEPVNPSDPAEYVSVTDVLPPDTEVVTLRQTTVSITTATGRAGIGATEGEAWHPSFHGRYRLVDGRGPRSVNEIAVTAAALDRLGAELGDEVELLSPERRVAVVGLIDDATLADSEAHLYGELGAFGAGDAPSSNAMGRVTDGTHYLPSLALDWADVEKLNESGVVVYSRDVQLDPPPPGTYRLHDSNQIQGAAGTILTLGSVIAGFAVIEIALLAGAAFAVGARRDQRMLATVASVGGTRRTLFQVVSLGGVVLGLIGGAAGIGLGIAAASAFMAATHDGSAVQYWGYHLNWPVVAGIAVFALVVGWIAALVPAVIASRIDVVAALRGARRPPKPSTRRPAFGALLIAAGVGVAVLGAVLHAAAIDETGFIVDDGLRYTGVALVFVGPVLAQVGVILAAPLVLRGAARLLSRAGIGARLGTRDAARNPARAVPALAAITTTVFVASLLMVVVASGEVASRQGYQHWTLPGQVQVDLRGFIEEEPRLGAEAGAALEDSLEVSAVRTLRSVPESLSWEDPSATRLLALPSVNPAALCPADPRSPEYPEDYEQLPAAERAELDRDPRCASTSSYVSSLGWNDKIWVGEPEDFELILGEPLSSTERDMLVDGGVVSLYPEYVHADDAVHLEWWSEQALIDGTSYGADPEAASPERVEAVPAVVHEPAVPIVFGMFMLESTADDLGLEVRPSLVLASLATMPTDAEQDALRERLDSLVGRDALFARVETGPPAFAGPTLWALLGAAALITLAASAVAIGLARIDGRRDDATLHAVGGSRRVRRSFSFWQTLVIAGLGSFAGAALGLVPVWAMSLTGGHGTMPFAAPWLHLGLVVVALPLAIAIGSWLTARGAQGITRTVIA